MPGSPASSMMHTGTTVCANDCLINSRLSIVLPDLEGENDSNILRSSHTLMVPVSTLVVRASQGVTIYISFSSHTSPTLSPQTSVFVMNL
jgi:hypothetical protein